MVSQKRASLSWIYARKGLSPKDGRGLLQIGIYLDRKQRKYIGTGEHFTEEDWKLIEAAWKDGKKIKKLNSDLALKLDKIKQFWHGIEEFETGLILQGKALNFELLENYLKKKQKLSFNDFMQNQLDTDKSLKATTKRPHQNTVNKLKEYKERIEFNEVNFTLIEGFDNYLRAQGLNQNSIQGHHVRLGKYINNAIIKDLIEKNPYAGFKKKGEKVEREFLIMEEIERIEVLDYSDNLKLDRIKDLFLFSCYCGLRYSDLMDLKREHLLYTEKGIEIKKKQIKVGSTVHLPLHVLFNRKGELIVKKYLKDGQEALFQAISNQKANENLKYIQHDAKISKNLTMHTARHTFGTQIAARTPDHYLISKLLGHRDIKSSECYVHMAKEIVNEKLDKIEW